MKLSKKKSVEGMVLAAPLLLGCLVFYAIPFVLVFQKSFTKGIGNEQKFSGTDHYESMFKNEMFVRAFGNTIKFLVIALPLILFISFIVAVILTGQARKHPFLRSVILLPYVMPVVGTVLIIDHLFASSGLVNESLYALGLPIVDWLNSEWAFIIVILLYLWKNTGYAVILLLSGLTTIPGELYGAASIDGASKFHQLRYITLPQMWYCFFLATVFSLINAFKCFREIFLIGGTYPHNSIYMLQHFINNSFEKMSYPKLAVASILLLIVIVIIFAVFYRLVLRKGDYRG